MLACRDQRGRSAARRGWALLATLLIPLLLATPAQAQLLPADFFSKIPAPGSPAAVEANTLSYDARTDVISATGRVAMEYDGYTIACDVLTYNQASGRLLCSGNVTVSDPDGNRFETSRVEVTDSLKKAAIEALTVTTSAGAVITASSASFSTELQNVLVDATYSPCGLCIDEKGRRIGWRVKSARIVQDPSNDSITLENTSLEILGVPVAWLPWISLPDPTKPRLNGFRLPMVDYSSKRGASLGVPYFIAIGEDTDILLTPTLMSRQGFLMAADWEQRFDYGAFTVSASGLYQLDPSAYAGTVGERDWRGAIQTTGHFVPRENWTAGWSYTAFSDAAYLEDYGISDDKKLVDEVYAQYLTDDSYLDLRLQQFRRLGNVTEAEQDEQALALPNAGGDQYFNLGDYGQVHVSARVQAIYRDADSTDLYGSVPYRFGVEGRKQHATIEASWEKQFIGPAGIVMTPYLALRADAAEYDGASALMSGPVSLLEATPIAAMDIRWPLLASNGADSHLFEPIAQVVYRGSDTTLMGLTNDNAHSFVLDDTNIFSYNRFTGTDRQETGLRANVGGRYLANFADGSWLELLAGQSFHLAGVNALAVGDAVNTGIGTGLGADASDIVLAARGSPFAGATLGAKLQIDPHAAEISRAGIGAEYAVDDYLVGGDYIYLPADATTGVLADQHEVTLRVGAPLPMDYWKAKGSLSWDLASSTWLEATGEVLYDDGFFLAGVYGKITGPTHEEPDDTSFGVKLRLKGPGDGSVF